MTDYQRIKYYFDKGWASKAQVATYVQYGKITPEEYEQITGAEYSNT